MVTETIREGGIYWIAPVPAAEHDARIARQQNEWSYISESALDVDPVTGALRPHLFTSWEAADKDGLTLVFKLHPKLVIHDKPPWNGRQFTAEDAAWNLERIGGLYAERLKLPSASLHHASLFANIAKARMVDTLTLKVTLTKPDSWFFNGLGDARAALAPREMDDIGWKDP